MQFCRRTPGPPLDQFVDLFWTWDGMQQPHQKERLLPDGAVALVINLREDETRIYDPDTLRPCSSLPGASIAGPHSRYFVIDTAEQLSVAGVQFKPGGAFPFFGMPADELGNQHVGLDALWGNWAGELRERLLEARTAESRLLIMEQAVLARASCALEKHRAVSFALSELQRGPDLQRISQLTDRIGLSPKRFIDVFRRQVGLTPKLYCRIRRFQNVLGQVHSGRDLDWTDVALTCGYFDQAHFIHDFRAFSGINPTAYSRLALRHSNHVPILD